MNEEVIRQMIRLKMTAAEGIIDRLSPEVTKRIIDLGKLVFTTIEECLESGKTENSNTVAKSVTPIHIE